MRQQRRELSLNGSVMFVVGTNQNPVPVPATRFRGFNQQQHLTLEEVGGKPTEHSFGEEGRALNKRLENPLVFKRLHVFESRAQPRTSMDRRVAASRHRIRAIAAFRVAVVTQE